MVAINLPILVTALASLASNVNGAPIKEHDTPTESRSARDCPTGFSLSEQTGFCIPVQENPSWERSLPAPASSYATRGLGSGSPSEDDAAPGSVIDKRKLSAYMLFANAMRDRVRDENPNITFGQLGKILGELWRALDPAEKAKYEDAANQKRSDAESAHPSE